ncbi:MAG: Mu transposase domain-containing protein [Segatella copri]
MNARIYELMDGFNEKPSRTTGRSRRDIFEAEEHPTLGKLPMTPYRFRYRKEVKLSGTYHVMVDKHNYSVPYQYVGQKVSVLWDLDTVEVYSGSSRIAIHQRRQGSGYSTLDEHMPDKHLAYKHGQGYNAAYFLEEAALVGCNTTAAVQSILNRTKHVEQSYKSCQGVLSLKRKYGKERLEKACKRLAGCSSITYTTIRNVLEKNLDQVDGEETVSNVPQNDYVRGAEAFMNI